ncbi:alpha/beta hydrolase [Spirulina subsalsa FACHB-351]|uniref:Alpha/beta hydrolase n=1 Tax=Spirulina subsalsa FACHB-351 TaxID=234711 RepID=A0ABT3L457_9CYAN|nr:alpha/beta hydrolase [Spirulina subsalsa]MCW6036276.1 alpha/beta hydrolase [Spirulina subsalsa FACHB-351]
MDSQAGKLARGLSHPVQKALRWGGMCAVGVGSSLLVAQAPTPAAERVIITYGPLRQSVLVEDLERFVETGEMSSSVRFLVNLSGQEPENVRQVLDYKVGVNFLFLHNVLNTLPGEYLLFETGNFIHTKSRRANIQSLRAALVLSARENNEISILEFLQNYPTQDMYIDGVAVTRFSRQVSRFVDQFRGFVELPIAIIQDFLGGFLCDCD